MFAYCLNDPVNRLDIAGTVSIWYYLIVDHDMGFIHRMVQAHIAANNPNVAAELVLTGLGRADIVDTSIGVVWEVKHAGTNPGGRMVEAATQAVGYIGGVYSETTIYGLGNALEFEGSFLVTVSNSVYQVEYNTPANGVILYTAKEVQDNAQTSTSTVYAYQPKKKAAPSKMVAMSVGVMALGGCAVPCSFSKDFWYSALALGE